MAHLTTTAAQRQPKPSPKNFSTQQKLQILRKELNASILEKEDEIDLVLLVIFGQTSLMLIGPPGSAKSYVTETIVKRAIKDAKIFVYMLHKFVEPREIYGPTDILALKNGQNRIITTGKFPECDYAFLDEYWNGSIAINQTMQRGLNEKELDVGFGMQKLPLRGFIVASNKFPEEQEVQALRDRMVLSLFSGYCDSPSNRSKLSSRLDHTPNITVSFTLAELDRAYETIMSMGWPDRVNEKKDEIVEKLILEGIRPSDRKLTKIRQIVQAYAYILGETKVHIEHLEVLKHMLWTTGEEGERKKCHRIVCELANPIGFAIGGLYKEVESVLKNCTPVDTETKISLIVDKLEEDFDQDDVRVKAIIEHCNDELKKNRIRMAGLSPKKEN